MMKSCGQDTTKSEYCSMMRHEVFE